jgi:putative oxidoreductase
MTCQTSKEQTMNTATVTARPAAGPSGRANTLLWAAQIMLAAVFAFTAVPKLAGAHTAVTMFGQIGAGQWLRYLVGTAELAGAAGLLIPRLAGLAAAGLAAAGLAADMAGASVINAAVLHSAAVAMTIPLCAVFTLIAASRREQIKDLAAPITRHWPTPARPPAIRPDNQDR